MLMYPADFMKLQLSRPDNLWAGIIFIILINGENVVYALLLFSKKDRGRGIENKQPILV